MNTLKDGKPLQVSSHSWMSKWGVRRYFLQLIRQRCRECGQPLNRVYRFHPFPMPAQFGKGMWLNTDCSCVKQKQLAIQNTLQQVTIKPETRTVLPPALRTHTFANFKVEEFNKKAFTVCTQFAKNFARNSNGKGIILCGKSGRGKTHLACAIVNFIHSDYHVEFAHIPTLLENIRRGKGELDQMLAADLLVLDDLGSERGTDWSLEKLLIIVDGRLNQLKPTVYTTNFNLDELELRIGSRLASRILNNSLDLVVQGPDWREIQYKQASK